MTMTHGASKRSPKLPSYGSKEGNDVAILLDSKVAIEKKGYVSTGVLTYVSGDMIEIELPQYDVFLLGEKVKMIVYTKSGMFVFDSIIVAKEKGSLVVINPPENRRRFNEKRQYSRVELEHTALLHAIIDPLKEQPQPMDSPLALSVTNMSMGGMGILLPFDMGMKKTTRLEIEMDIGVQLRCMFDIIHVEKHNQGIYYGVGFNSFPIDKVGALRAFLLQNQVKSYFKQKQQDTFNKVQHNMQVIEEASEANAVQEVKTTAQGMHINK